MLQGQSPFSGWSHNLMFSSGPISGHAVDEGSLLTQDVLIVMTPLNSWGFSSRLDPGTSPSPPCKKLSLVRPRAPREPAEAFLSCGAFLDQARIELIRSAQMASFYPSQHCYHYTQLGISWIKQWIMEKSNSHADFSWSIELNTFLIEKKKISQYNWVHFNSN